MILVFDDAFNLQLHADIEQVLMHCEPIDVDSGLYTFYDDKGRALKPVFDVPVKSRNFLWLFETVSGGEYHLEQDTSGDTEHILFALLECTHMEPHSDFETLAELKSFLREQGVMVDAPDSSA